MTTYLCALATVALALIAAGCATQDRLARGVSFDQLIYSHDRLSDRLVRLRCVLTLFDERTFFTANGMTPDFKAEVIYFRGDGASWRNDDVSGRMIESARREHNRFRSAHPEVAWASIEVEVDVEGIFSSTKPYIAYYLAPGRVHGFHLLRNVGLDPSGRLLVFPIGAEEAEPGATDNPDDAQRLREDH